MNIISRILILKTIEMNVEVNKKMEEIINNLQNWQKIKKDSSLLNDLLINANYFEISYSVPDDHSEHYHLYPAVEIAENTEKQSKAYNLIFYMISKNRDNKEFLDKNKDHIDQFINKFPVINRDVIQGTEISKEEARNRKSRWNNEIEKWLSENTVFEVFEIPKEDFTFNDDQVIMQGHFGIKDIVEWQNDNPKIIGYCPDIMIYQINSLDKTESFFDMAKLSPPFRNREHEKEFSLLKYNL